MTGEVYLMSRSGSDGEFSERVTEASEALQDECGKASDDIVFAALACGDAYGVLCTPLHDRGKLYQRLSFCLMISTTLARLFGSLSNEVSNITASGAGFSGALARFWSRSSRFFISAKTVS